MILLPVLFRWKWYSNYDAPKYIGDQIAEDIPNILFDIICRKMENKNRKVYTKQGIM